MSEKTSLTEAPTNLKEAIDWLLCISGNDVAGDSGDGKKAIQKLATKVITLVMSIQVSGISFGNVHGQHIGTLLKDDVSSGNGNYRPIESLGNGLRVLIGYGSGILNGKGIGAKERYSTSYSDSSPPTSVNTDDAAKRFLGFIPLIFFALGFLFWQCKGGWKNLTLGRGLLKAYMGALGFTGHIDASKQATDVDNWFALFDEFKNVESIPTTFPEYLSEVEKKTKQTISNPNHVPLG
ncbi:variant erythrocyte surface antigen-1 family protein [Babesia caballi]|uniref:Variant erythrocyte surface antigen-1 family protein n=1 Tax=Babesia caballi TaxID=5871 RepID=A0AAV4LP83_BABCB|nr:variant erythrocyte surface antigen-1 family protein [Babesia caballi]